MEEELNNQLNVQLSYIFNHWYGRTALEMRIIFCAEENFYQQFTFHASGTGTIPIYVPFQGFMN
jgi:hypothetical protein